jgi:hypothetical protein
MMTRRKGARSMATKIGGGAERRSCQMWDDGGPGCGMAVFDPAVVKVVFHIDIYLVI